MPALQLAIEINDKGQVTKVTNIDAAFGKLKDNVGKHSKSITDNMDRINNVTHGLAQSMRGLSIIGGASLGALGGLMFKTGAAFEQSMANVKAASGATTAELRGLSLMAREYAKTTVFSAKEVADAMRQLAKEGMKAAEIKDTIGKALLFAGATGMELAQTIDSLDNLMDTFGISAANAGELVGILTGAMSVTPIDALMTALYSVGPVAAELGMDIKSLTIDFALLEKVGIAGTRAGRAYGLMLQQLVNPSKEASVMLGNMKFTGDNLRAVLDRIKSSGASATDIMAAFGAKGGAVVSKLMAATAEQISNVGKALDNTSAAQAAFNDRMATSEARMKMFKNSMQEYMLDMFDKLAPKVTAYLETHQALIRELVLAVPKVVALALAFQGLAWGISTTTTVSKVAIPVFTFLGNAMGGLLAAIGLGYTAALLFDKTLRAIGVGNPLANIRDAWHEITKASDKANLSAAAYRLNMPLYQAGLSRANAQWGAGMNFGPGTGGPPAATAGAASAPTRIPGAPDAMAIIGAQMEAADTLSSYMIESSQNAAFEGQVAQMQSDAAVAQARLDWNEAVWQDWQAKNEGMLALAYGLEAAWDTMVESALDKEMSGKQRREAMWESMKQSFLRSTSDMLKKELIMKIKNWVTAEAAQKPFTMREKFDAAKVAAVKAYSAFASIPLVGPVLGAIAAAATFAFLMAFHKGGFVNGRGLRADEGLAVLQSREFVVNRGATESIGRGNLEYMNATGRIPPSTNVGVGPFVFNVSGAKGDADDIVTFIEDKVVPMLESAIVRRKFSLVGEA